MLPPTRPGGASRTDRHEIAAVRAAVARLVAAPGSWVDVCPAGTEDAGEPSGPVAVDGRGLRAPEGLERVRSLVADSAAPAVVSVLHVLHELPQPGATIDLLVELAEAGATVVVSVPDVAPGTWGANAVEQVRRLLPADARTLRVVALQGAAVLPEDDADTTVTVEPLRVSDPPAAVAWVLAFGPRAGELAPGGARMAIADVARDRAEEQELLAALDVLRAERARA